MTWICHICKDERPDHLISVLVKPLEINGQVLGNQNVRYCNDRIECQENAQTFSFICKT